MAEGWLRHLAGDRFVAQSAGVTPTEVNPFAIEVMKEAGVDISAQRSKDAATLLGEHFGFLITVCGNAKESCPVFPGSSHREHWPVEDPAHAEGSREQKLAVFRATRDELEHRVRRFIHEQTGDFA
jgi:arsenate reductase (thioredoxin)